MLTRRSLAGLAALITLSTSFALGCAANVAPQDGDQSDDALTGTTSAERGIHFQGYVYVDAAADDATIGQAVARQVKTAIGALRNPKVSLNDRAARTNLDKSKWTRTQVTVVDPAKPTAPGKSLLKVTYRYDDKAVVTNTLATRSSVDFTMLAGDYAANFQAIKGSCSDDQTTDADSLWFHFTPQQTACKTAIQNEARAITTETQARRSAGAAKIGPREAGRWFLPVTAKLDAPALPAVKFAPEYDRLYGLGTSKDKVIVYAFLGVDGYAAADAYNPDDALGQEAVKFLRTMLSAQPNFRPVKTEPGAMLLDLFVDGKKLDGVTYERMFQWVVDKTGYPAEVGTDTARITDLRKQVMAKFAERWIYWDLPVTVRDGATDKNVTIEVRSYYGQEDGSPDARQHAQWRYLEAFWYGDVFVYNGHSHFGHGPLEPTNFGPQNWNDRYQIMAVNSCVSYNYYHQDFLQMKPGGSKNLDMVVNGLPSWVLGGGEAMARLVTGLIDGSQKSYVDLLQSMRLDMPWGEKAYDPMRVVDGELDNVYDAKKRPLTLTVGAPVY